MLFTLYPPQGAHVRSNVQVRSTWLRPIVNGEEGYKYIGKMLNIIIFFYNREEMMLLLYITLIHHLNDIGRYTGPPYKIFPPGLKYYACNLTVAILHFGASTRIVKTHSVYPFT